MIYLELFLGFLKVGCFSFGGAYGAIPVIREVVLSYGWLSEDYFTYLVAVSESTPGPIMVNMATYIGSTQGGILGSAIATFAVTFPAFLIILCIAILLKNLLKHPYAIAVLNGIKPCITGIITATGLYMILDNTFGLADGFSLEWKSILITFILFAACFLYKKRKEKPLSPIMLIILSACCGIVVYGIQ